jgi:hypothetical protein
MKINGAKCNWLATPIQLLGHIVSADGVAINPEKVSAIHELKYHKNVKDVQRFLGRIGYYRKYIHKNYKNYRTSYKLNKKGCPI